MDDGFKIAMVVTACLSLAGGLIAFLMIDSEVLETMRTPNMTATAPPPTATAASPALRSGPGATWATEPAAEPVGVSEPSR